MTSRADGDADGDAHGCADSAADDDVVLLDVVAPDGRRYAVAALADEPLRQLAAALTRLLGITGAHELYGDGSSPWDQATTLRELGVLHGTVVRLVPSG